MKQVNEPHIFKGLQRDLSISKFDVSFLYDAHNIRLTARESDTLLSVTNEKGPKETNMSITGTYLGHCLFNEFLVIFSTTSTAESAGLDYITRVDLKSNSVVPLYTSTNGSLKFDIAHKIETIGSYENDSIQKVYWTDGLNQPRLINIAPSNDGNISKYNSNSFNFVQELTLAEHLYIDKAVGADGLFAPGTIQYCFTYYNKYSQESNVVQTSPLSYISHIDRGEAANKTVSNAFTVRIDNVDKSFDFVRVYSIQRTSIDSTPIVKRLIDIPTTSASTVEVITESSDNNRIISLDNLATVEIATDGITFRPLTEVLTPTFQPPSGKWGTDKFYKIDYSQYPNCACRYRTSSGYRYIKELSAGAGTSLYINSVASIWDLNEYGVFRGHIILSYTGNTLSFLNTESRLTYTDSVSFIDNGTIGEDFDPTVLAFLGGEEIVAQTIEQKDGTLFLGNLEIKRPPILETLEGELQQSTQLDLNNPSAAIFGDTLVSRHYDVIATGDIPYSNSLGYNATTFKGGEYYRLGVQFQYKNGKWSNPIWLGDHQVQRYPSFNEETGVAYLPQIHTALQNTSLKKVRDLGYKRMRPVVVFPTAQERTILCQGVINPTVYRPCDRYGEDNHKGIDENGFDQGPKDSSKHGNLYAQASWIYRPSGATTPQDLWDNQGGGGISYEHQRQLFSQYLYNIAKVGTDEYFYSPYLRSTEIQGYYDEAHRFYVDWNTVTLDTPELIFDDTLIHSDLACTSLYTVGYVDLTKTFADIDLQTSTPPMSAAGKGFIKRTIAIAGNHSLISGTMYHDYIVDDGGTTDYEEYSVETTPVGWPVYMWHKNGSINNDTTRENRSANLSRKVISNYKSGHSVITSQKQQYLINTPQVHNTSELQILKINKNIYQGNIDTLLVPSTLSPLYFCGSYLSSNSGEVDWLTAKSYMAIRANQEGNDPGIWQLEPTQWVRKTEHIGNKIKGLSANREPVRMKYKSSPHIVMQLQEQKELSQALVHSSLPLAELRRPYRKETMFGGTSDDALQNALWLPAGNSVDLPNTTQGTSPLYYDWGDTYYQRYEHLKTYSYTPEDINQVIEILSFMVETHINIDGRYDRNRGQSSNLNVSSINFNLLNPVYSQKDNFFNYRIIDKKFYNLDKFSNQITWTKEKQPGSDTDLWTNITLASTYDINGSKGEIQSLNLYKDQLFCFQDRGISNILFNSRVQVPTSDGVPIELTNSYKVDGCRYMADGIGCNNKWTIKATPAGIYFINSVNNNLYHLGDGTSDISTTHNLTTWFKHNEVKKTLYDDINHDVYLLTDTEALCYSELLGQFTSFMSYDHLDLIESYNKKVFTFRNKKLYEMFAGDYNMYFGTYYPWDITIISNGKDQSAVSMDKLFTNLEYRMDLSTNDYLHDESFDYLQVSNEYQDTGIVPLSFTKNKVSNLKKKFRIWHIDIPRNTKQDAIGKGSRDRIRNTWCKIKLGMWDISHPKFNSNKKTAKAELHDLITQYWI